MATHDYNIANQSFPSYRSDHNASLLAIVSKNSSTTAPSTTYAYMWWYDSTNDILKMRNASNTDWISFASFDQLNGTVDFLDSSFTTMASDLSTNGFDINFTDNSKAQFGNSQDLQIYHDGSNSYIQDGGAGNLLIQGSSIVRIRTAGGAEEMASFTANGASVLYHNNTAKISTTSSGASITGDLTTTNDITVTGGDISTNRNIESGRGSGGVALTVNDGHGNANVTFNHNSGNPEQDGNSARIVVNTDSSSDSNMEIEFASGVTAGVSPTLIKGAKFSDTDQILYHSGTNRLQTTSSGVTINGTITADSYSGISTGLTLIQEQQVSGNVSSVTFSSGLSDFENFILVGIHGTGGQGNDCIVDLKKAGSTVVSLTVLSNHGNENEDISYFKCFINSRRYAYIVNQSLTNGEGGTGYSYSSNGAGATGGDTGNVLSGITIRVTNSNMKTVNNYKLYGVTNA